jgi:hypothetical protein
LFFFFLGQQQKNTVCVCVVLPVKMPCYNSLLKQPKL